MNCWETATPTAAVKTACFIVAVIAVVAVVVAVVAVVAIVAVAAAVAVAVVAVATVAAHAAAKPTLTAVRTATCGVMFSLNLLIATSMAPNFAVSMLLL